MSSNPLTPGGSADDLEPLEVIEARIKGVRLPGEEGYDRQMAETNPKVPVKVEAAIQDGRAEAKTRLDLAGSPAAPAPAASAEEVVAVEARLTSLLEKMESSQLQWNSRKQ